MFQRKEVEIFMEIYVANIKFFKLVISFFDVYNSHTVFPQKLNLSGPSTVMRFSEQKLI